MQPENVQNVQNVLDVLDVLNVLNVSAVTYGLQMTSAEDCAVFSSKLEQKLSYVQAMYPEKLSTKQ